MTVIGRCPCGCPTIDLRIDESAPRSVHPGVPSLALWGTAGEPDDPEAVVDLSVWAPEGALTELNVGWYGGNPPATLPDAKDVAVGPGPEPIRVDDRISLSSVRGSSQIVSIR